MGCNWSEGKSRPNPRAGVCKFFFFSEKGQRVIILGFVNNMVSVITTQFCCNMKAAINNRNHLLLNRLSQT